MDNDIEKLKEDRMDKIIESIEVMNDNFKKFENRFNALDNTIENKVNKSLVNHYGKKYQHLLIFFAGVSAFLFAFFNILNNFKTDYKADMQNFQNIILMQYQKPYKAPTQPQKAESAKNTKPIKKASL